MKTRLTFDYDEAGDILYISKVPPYPEQDTEQLAYNVAARRNPHTGALESLEILFFARSLLEESERPLSDLWELLGKARA